MMVSWKGQRVWSVVKWYDGGRRNREGTISSLRGGSERPYEIPMNVFCTVMVFHVLVQMSDAYAGATCRGPWILFRCQDARTG
jgi:hypothetical protein